jgi:hypothetical protein
MYNFSFVTYFLINEIRFIHFQKVIRVTNLISIYLLNFLKLTNFRDYLIFPNKPHCWNYVYDYHLNNIQSFLASLYLACLILYPSGTRRSGYGK